MAASTWQGALPPTTHEARIGAAVRCRGPGDTGTFHHQVHRAWSNFDFIQTLAGWTFNSGNYTFTFGSSEGVFFDGAGIVVNGGSVTLISNSSANFVNFFGSSSAGSATINANSGSVQFANSATGGNAAINLAASTFLGFVE